MRRHVPLALAACTVMLASGSAIGATPSAATADRAVVVIQGGGTPHPYSTPWAACEGGRPHYV